MALSLTATDTDVDSVLKSTRGYTTLEANVSLGPNIFYGLVWNSAAHDKGDDKIDPYSMENISNDDILSDINYWIETVVWENRIDDSSMQDEWELNKTKKVHREFSWDISNLE